MTKKKTTIISSISSQIAALFLREHLQKGGTIDIPSLNITGKKGHLEEKPEEE